MTDAGVSSRYANALVDVLTAPNAKADARQALGGLQDFVNVLDQSRDLELVLSSPSINPQRKRVVIEKIAGSLELPKPIRNFLFVLSDHRRLPLLREVTDRAFAVLDERLGFLRADIASAAPLNDEERWLIAENLWKMTGKQIRIEATVDPDLIGGVVARVGSKVYDGSVRGRLRALGERLASNDLPAGNELPGAPR